MVQWRDVWRDGSLLQRQREDCTVRLHSTVDPFPLTRITQKHGIKVERWDEKLERSRSATGSWREERNCCGRLFGVHSCMQVCVCVCDILHLSAESSQTPDGVSPRWRSHEASPEDYQTCEPTGGGYTVINHACYTQGGPDLRRLRLMAALISSSISRWSRCICSISAHWCCRCVTLASPKELGSAKLYTRGVASNDTTDTELHVAGSNE